MQARNDFLDQGRYPKIDLVNRGKINEIRLKGRETNEEKKIANISTLQFVSAKMPKKCKNLLLEKKSLLGSAREDAEIKSESRLSYTPTSSAKIEKANRFLMKNKG